MHKWRVVICVQALRCPVTVACFSEGLSNLAGRLSHISQLNLSAGMAVMFVKDFAALTTPEFQVHPLRYAIVAQQAMLADVVYCWVFCFPILALPYFAED